MKTLLTLFVLLLSPSVLAEDIRDFQIDGMSIGDSLLDYFSEEEINGWGTNYHQNSKKFVQLFTPFLSNNKYEQYNFYIKDKDPNFIIYSARGGKTFDDIEDCKKFKNKIVKDIIPLFKNTEPTSYNYIYDYLYDGKSVAYITDFNFDEGSVRIYCIDWSKVTEENSTYEDNVSVDISSREFLDWLNNEAN